MLNSGRRLNRVLEYGRILVKMNGTQFAINTGNFKICYRGKKNESVIISNDFNSYLWIAANSSEIVFVGWIPIRGRKLGSGYDTDKTEIGLGLLILQISARNLKYRIVRSIPIFMAHCIISLE